jgi:hypothetical protein
MNDIIMAIVLPLAGFVGAMIGLWICIKKGWL